MLPLSVIVPAVLEEPSPQLMLAEYSAVASAPPGSVKRATAPPKGPPAGPTAWYLYDLNADRILDEPGEIIDLIRCQRDTPRRCRLEQQTLSEVRAKVERHIKNTYLKRLQAPVGV